MSKVELHPLIENRYSLVAFDTKEIEDDKLISLFEAAGKAASSYNDQPWRFIYAKRGDKGFDKIANLLSDSNQLWAPKAAALVLCVARKTLTRNEKPNKHSFHDLGLAVANLTFQANHIGLFLHQMGGFDYEKAQEVYEIPSNYEPHSVLAIGYPGDVNSLSGVVYTKATKESVRKNVDEIAFHEEWKEKTNQ